MAGAAEAAGHDVKVLDLCFAPGNFGKTIKKAVESFRPQLIGISVRNIDNVNMIHSVCYLPEITRIVHQVRRCADVTLVVGGSGASLMPAQVMRLLSPDYIVVADGEVSFVRLLDALENGRSPQGIPGVGMMVDGRFHLTKPELTDFAAAAPDLGRWIDLKPYQKIGSSYNLQTKRGCRQHCIYCTYNQALEGNKLRLRSPVDVVDEIEEALLKYGPKSFEFVDSVFNDPVDHSVAILEEIIRRPWKAEFTAMGMNPKQLDKQFLGLMWRAGFRAFMITPESASPTMIRNYRKGFSPDDIFSAVEAINRTAFAAWWFFMIGGPGENNRTLQESLDFALKYLQKNGRPVTHVAHFFTGVRVYPGTALWDIAFKEGFVRDDTDASDTLWYLSEDLDLEEAVEQMSAAAATCPEVYLGFDERVLMFSKAAAMVFKLLKLPRPYWRYFRAANSVGLSTGIRFMFRPRDIAGLLKNSLRRQGYAGRLVP
ncbi:MAG: cobalamin B12-binding domain-containing protein [Desulfomonile tiedjei]|uniref:Cobalamin B12-binding domain-containing protein n=1 Tax=Desulfomonile tiedjei TaxID=2358 RepID=A0A9D6Z173_9BACT|nr:cobalamin B12-binding domain-containing protein [Desulfomonile tiedjei]